MLHCFGLVIFHDVAVAHRSSRHRVSWARKIAVAISRGKTASETSRIQCSPRFFQVTLLGVLSDLFRGLSDLHLGYQKVTWKKLVEICFFSKKQTIEGFFLEMDGFANPKNPKKSNGKKNLPLPHRAEVTWNCKKANSRTCSRFTGVGEKFPRFSASKRICWEKKSRNFCYLPKKDWGKKT